MYPTINPRKCNGCGNCADICPSEVYGMAGDQPSPIRPEDCIECWACVSQCPAEAIDLQED
jgi:NAD-dependent dihydropyrimidine dehydrogenase PreA subunit